MLKKMNKLLLLHKEAFLLSLRRLLNEPMATVFTILAVSITFILPSLFWMVTLNVKNMPLQWQKAGYISLFLKDSIQEQEAIKFAEKLRKQPHIEQVTLKTPSESLSLFKEQEGMEDIIDYLPNNPLPYVIEITPGADISSPVVFDALYQKLKQEPFVQIVKFDVSWAERLYNITIFFKKLGEMLLILLMIALILIISNTLRLSIHTCQEEIEILKLIGARASYIARPFLYTGMLYALLGASFALFCTYMIWLSLDSDINRIVQHYGISFQFQWFNFRQIVDIFASALLLGWIAAYASVKWRLFTLKS